MVGSKAQLFLVLSLWAGMVCRLDINQFVSSPLFYSLATIGKQENFTITENSDALPKFEFFEEFITQKEVDDILEKTQLGDDPSSLYFLKRTKAIRFVSVANNEVKLFNQDYFIQHQQYNDFSGGYRRYYAIIPEDVILGSLKKSILNYVKYNRILDGTPILLQIQSTILELSIEKIDSNNRSNDVTGQGIHSDGSNHGLLICLHRGRNIRGALNQFHNKLDGSQPVGEPHLLLSRSAVTFQDNMTFHHVTDATLLESTPESNQKYGDNVRTMVLMNAPATMFMDGTSNYQNIKLANQAAVQLKNHKKQNEELLKNETSDIILKSTSLILPQRMTYQINSSSFLTAAY